MGVNIPHWLEKQNDVHPQHTAIEEPDGFTMTFSELRKESREAASGLLERGVMQGDHIALLADNHRNVPILIHALSYVGAVIVLLNTRLSPKELAFQLNDARVSHLFVGQGLEEKAQKAVEQQGIYMHNIEGFAKGEAEDQRLKNELDLDEVFTMMYTSGTTGNPKAVMHTYGNHWFSAISSALNLGVTSEDKWLLCLPMFHVSGFSILMKSVIYGMTISLVTKFDEEVINREIIWSGVTHISVVTVMLQRLLQHLGSETYPEHFRCMLLGGGPVPELLLHKTSKKQIPVYQTYGMTETSSQIATLSPAFAFQKIGSAGKALSTAEVIIDSEGSGEVGEILVQGPMVSPGYYHHPPINERYLRTGDLGYKDEEGFLYVVDRVKDVIISGGENIYPAEIESVLSEFPGVVEAGVTGKEDEEWGEVPVGFIVMREKSHFDEEEIKQFCSSRLAKYKIPTKIHVLSQLPRNASKKLLRRKLFEIVQEERNNNET